MSHDNTLYLVDGSSYIYRAYFAIRHLSSPSGHPTNAIYGFIQMLLKLLKDYDPQHVAVVFDAGRITFRTEMYPEYKANRAAMPDDLRVQMGPIREVVRAFNIPTLELNGFEADDIIGALAGRFSANGGRVVVVTGDKDLMQIVTDKVTLLDTMKDKQSGVAEVIERFGVGPERVTDILGLAGDSSDNIPGVPGIGEKTAAELVRRFGSLDGVLKWRSLVNGKQRRANLETYAEQARLSKVLATVRYDVPLAPELAALRRQSPNLPLLLPLLQQLELAALALAFTPPPPGVVEIYSDGSGRDSGPGGYGVILRHGENEKELCGFEPLATSQRMELLAAIRGLEALSKRRTVRVFSDSQYLVRGMREWLPGWIRNGRLDTPDALANQDLWQQLATLAAKHQVHWEWVRGHAGHPFNERCDQLAKRAVETGLQAAALLQSEAVRAEAANVEPVVPVTLAPVPHRVDADFESEDDGQLRLC
ncbi:MAG TPA: ribonuclease HI [Desulfuromonas sp.]|nr:ribonuclease HI [Desulfuromonas sp.]